jgi:hypothetical protein
MFILLFTTIFLFIISLGMSGHEIVGPLLA